MLLDVSSLIFRYLIYLAQYFSGSMLFSTVPSLPLGDPARLVLLCPCISPSTCLLRVSNPCRNRLVLSCVVFPIPLLLLFGLISLLDTLTHLTPNLMLIDYHYHLTISYISLRNSSLLDSSTTVFLLQITSIKIYCMVKLNLEIYL